MAAKRRGYTRRLIKRNAKGQFARVAGSGRRTRSNLRGRRARAGMNMRFRKVSAQHRVRSAYSSATFGRQKRKNAKRNTKRLARRMKMGALHRESELFGFTPGPLKRNARRTQRRLKKLNKKWNP